MKSKSIRAAIVALLVAIAAYWYWSPYLAVWQIRNAAVARDAAAFNSHVDYPRLRESMKGQFAPLFMDVPGKSDDGGIGKAGAAFGKMLGMIVVDKAVDLLVRPETVMQAMRQGYMTPQVPKKVDPAAPPPPRESSASAASGDDKQRIVFERTSVNSLFVYAAQPPKADGAIEDKLGFVFERSGFATWKLSAVVLPIHAK